MVKGENASSTRWLQRQLTDGYVLAAHQQGRRSRAAFKLIEANAKLRFLKAGHRVLDLGAAPGGFSQAAAEIVGKSGFVIAVDELPLEPLERVHFLRMKLHPDQVDGLSRELLSGCALYSDVYHSSSSSSSASASSSKVFPIQKSTASTTSKSCFFDVVLCDMAPSASGDANLDHMRLMNLASLAAELAHLCLSPTKGAFFVKVSHGTDDIEFKNELKKRFSRVVIIKPPASRSDSREYYLFASR